MASSQPLSSDSFEGHPSSDIFAALVAHADQMNRVAVEHKAFLTSPDHPGTFEGHPSSDIAEAVAKYVQQHQGEGWPSDFEDSASSSPKAATSAFGATLGGAAHTPQLQGLAASVTMATSKPAFSLDAQIEAAQWLTIVLCIVWVASGILLNLFGWASYFWGTKLGTSRQRIDEKASKKKVRHLLCSGAPLGGGVGGALVGFHFLSVFALATTCAMCARDGTSVSSGALFVIWLLPGLFGAALGGHFAYVSRVFAGLFAGPCLAVIVTAMFGIRTLIIRVVVLVVFTCLLTAPLLVPKRRVLHFHLVNASTSIIGMMLLLDGVALYAPPRASSTAWLDLWVVMFAGDETASLTTATRKWGTSSFKGYIAGAVLGAVAGFTFELLFHKHAAQDPESEWNEYLGSYTHRFETGAASGAAGVLPGFLGGGSVSQRAGSFEPSPSAWSRIGDLFAGSASKPACYGNIPSAGEQPDLERSPLTERPGGMRKKRGAARKGGKKARTSAGGASSGPAKFSALSKRDDIDDGSDSDLTEYDSDDPTRKLQPKGSARNGGGGKDAELEGEDDDLVSPLARLQKVSASPGGMENYRGYALPRPPSYRTDSQGGSSTLSGSTAASGSRYSENSSGGGSLPSPSAEKAFAVYRDGDASPLQQQQRLASSPPPRVSATSPTPSSAAAPAAVPATPSLINAITRIQAAQAQARAWQDAQQGGAPAPYGAQPLSPPPPAEVKKLEGAEQGTAASNADAAAAGTKSFDQWWSKQVDDKAAPSPGEQ